MRLLRTAYLIELSSDIILSTVSDFLVLKLITVTLLESSSFNLLGSIFLLFFLRLILESLVIPNKKGFWTEQLGFTGSFVLRK